MRYLKRCLVNSIVISVLWVVLPTAAFAAVEITEVAWMGTVESQYGEWIELHNSGSELVSVDGWKLYQDGGGTLVFSLSKTIPAGGYLVIERATPSVPDPLPGVADESGTFGGSGLANTGEHLVLKDGSGLVVNSLSFGSGWPAGDATSKQTMQKSGNAWITADPTPKAATKDAVISEGEIDNTTSDPVDSSNGNTEPKIVWRPSIAFDASRQAFTGVPISIVATVTEESGMTTVGYFFWNLGDGTVIEQRNLAPVTAVYQYPGEKQVYTT